MFLLRSVISDFEMGKIFSMKTYPDSVLIESKLLNEIKNNIQIYLLYFEFLYFE